MAAEVNAISCPVCCEIYSDPRSLPCGHSFCLNCITGVADRRKTFPCPLCRFSVDLRDETVDKLPRNFGLCIVIDAKDITQASMCLEHNRPLDILCVECNILICSKCLFMQHKGHDSDDIDDIVIKQNMKLVGFLENTAHWTSMIQGKKDELKQSRDRTQRSVDSIQTSVDASFKKWYNALHVKQQSVLSYLDEETYKIMKKYDETERVLMSSMTSVTEVENEIKKMQRKDKAFVVLQRYSINASLEEVKHKVLMDTRTCLTSFDDIKIAVYAPWIEEAIDNIKPIDMKQTKASHPTKKISEIEEENIILKRRLINLEEKNKDELEFLRKKVSEERRKFEKDLQKNREQIKQLEEDRNELLNRLSSQAAARMTPNIPNITDLSDQNRPTKISERYSELYDNQWTDAFDILQKNHHLLETDAIEVLLDVLSVSFDECKEARRLRGGLLEAVKRYIGEDEDNEDMTILEVMRTLKGNRNIKKMQKEYNQQVHSKLSKNYKDMLPDIRAYMDECVEICLLMNIQEPPIEFRGLELLYGSAFDLSVFKTYTKSGNKIEYIVWPAMYLYQDGPLLCKGIAQGMCDLSNVLRPTDTKHNANRIEFTTEVNGQQRDPKRESMIVQVPIDKNVDNEQKQHQEKRKESLSSPDSRREISSHQPQNKTEKSITQDRQSDVSPHMDLKNQSTHTKLNHPTEKELQEKVENTPKIINKTVITVTTHL